MKRTVIGFHRDAQGDWVAHLDCGHGQHMRHRPPFQNRPWVVRQQGRDKMLGAELDCVRCVRMEWPDGVVAYRRTSEFDADSVPAGLAADHSTKGGVWARIHVLEGCLIYHVGPPIDRCERIAAGGVGIVVPEVRHRVEPEGKVRFFVEFSRAPRAGLSSSTAKPTERPE